jgi:hypothetical protein
MGNAGYRYCCFHQPDIRAILWDWLVATLSSDAGAYNSGAQPTVSLKRINKNGRTDILVETIKGGLILIEECKIWRGETYLRNAID